MSSQPQQQSRKNLTIILVALALVITVVEPLLMKQIVPDMLAMQKARDAGFPPNLIKIFFPVWMALGVVGSLTFLIVAKDFYAGKRWARGLALFVFAIPAITGAYMVGPLMVFKSQTYVQAIIITLLGLIPYFIILGAEHVTGVVKRANLIVFTILGVQAAHSFEMAHGSLKHQMVDPYGPTWPAQLFKTWMGNHVVWIGTACLILAILFLGMRKKSGWYLGMLGGAATMLGNYWAHIAVPGPTNDYLVGGTLGLAIVVILLLPQIKPHLYDDAEE